MKHLTFLTVLTVLSVTVFSKNGFNTVTDLSPVSIAVNTSTVPQSNVWTYAGKHWALLATSSGTNIYRLDGTVWTNVLSLASGNTIRADVKVVGNIAHIFTWKGTTSYLYSVQYDTTTNKYKLWTVRDNRVTLTLNSGVQTGTIDIDGTGRMWLAYDGDKEMYVKWSDAPYAVWSAPVQVASSTSSTDICAVIAMPALNNIGVFWSNKTTKRFGFVTHADGASPTTWSADEMPSAQSALTVGNGFADNQFNLKALANGNLFSVVKTGYDLAGYPQIGLLLRHPDGTWDPVYPVTTTNQGTNPIVVVNETASILKVAYTLGSGGITYRESSTRDISFGAPITLISGAYDCASSEKANYSAGVVVLACTSGSSEAAGIMGVEDTFPPPHKAPPAVTGINRQNPLAAITSASSVAFRIIFSEPVKAVNATDFALTETGTAGGVLASNAVVPVSGTGGTTYDVTVSSLTGSGDLRLDLKASGTGITDTAGNATLGGFTSGEIYTLQQASPGGGFATVTALTPLDIAQPTKDKPQAKTWKYAGKWWAALPATGGTKIFRLDGTSWTDILTLNSSDAKPDCWIAGDMVHILCYKGAGNISSIYSVKYDTATNTYKLWTARPTAARITFPAGSETSTIVIDGTGRMWAASDGLTDMSVWYSDAPYSNWSLPVTIATGAKNDDICALVTMPGQGKIGLFWSNQITKRYGFKTHSDGANPEVWSADELPASQSAIDTVGYGMADDHMNLKVASDGTIYVAAKTGYNAVGYPKLIMLVRHPDGVWDDQYTVTMNPEGTQPLLLLNETKGTLKIVYATIENGGDILYRESSLANISFGPAKTLISTPGVLYDYATSTHQNYSSDIVILATNVNATQQRAEGVIASDDVPEASKKIHMSTTPEQAKKIPGINEVSPAKFTAYPNPVTDVATLTFIPAESATFKIILYNSQGVKQMTVKEGWADAGTTNKVTLNGASLANGLYMINLQTGKANQTIKVLVQK